MTTIWSIPGGIHPPENKTQSLQLPIGDVSLPSLMVFPLNQHIGAPATPAVEVGQRVLGGQLIAAAKGPISANIHASTSGTVVAIEERTLPHPSGMSGPCIVIEPDGQDEFAEFEACEDYLALPSDTLVAKIRAAGITGMGGAGFPTAIKLSPKSNNPIDTLIINGTECEPYITADDILMQTRADEIVKGTQLLAQILNQPARVVIGIEDNKPAAIAAVQKAAAGSGIEVVSFPTKYPSGGEKQLIQILTGKEVPSGQLPASIGIVLQNVGTAVAAFEAVRFGKPLIERITTVVGDALQTQRNVRVRLGTPIHHVLAEHGFNAKQASRLIVGGPMMGYTLEQDDVPVVKTTNCILAPTPKELPAPPPAQACIRCGMCAEACPVSLLPQQMYWYARAEEYERLEAQNIKDCIECGACAYVCPSNIPLVQYYRAAKGTLRQMAIEKEKSDRSRKRFEFRQERMAKAEAEKEAKRLARKQAADAAKQKLEAQQSAGDSPEAGANANQDLVAAAMAKVQTRQQSPEDQKARLERSVMSARDRATKLQEKIASADGEMKEKLTAQLKQAELKLSEAETKLAQFKPDDTPAADDPVAAAIARAQAKMSMAPDEKLRANLQSLQERLQKAEDKIAQARAEGSDKVDALQSGANKLKEKITAAEKELAELGPIVATPPRATETDAAATAIERAKAKAAARASMSDEDKLRDQLHSMGDRLTKAQSKLQQAESDGADTVDALKTALEKLQAKRDELREQLRALNPAAPELSDANTQVSAADSASEKVDEPQDAAAAAIARAQAKAAAQASMSDEERLRDQVSAAQARLQKAQERLAKAEAESAPNLEAFRGAVEKSEAKLEKLQSELAALQ